MWFAAFAHVGHDLRRIAPWAEKIVPRHRQHAAVRRFFKIIRGLPWESDAADFYADIRHRLVVIGQAIGEMDVMIAARSMAIGAVLVTNNVRR